MKRNVSIFLIVIVLALLTACSGDTENIKVLSQNGTGDIMPLTIENFSFEVPTYWVEDEKTEDSLRYYAERQGKVAMLEFSYKVDEQDPVTWQMLYDEREKMINAIENSMSEIECKVSGYEEVVSNHGEKGFLYKYTFSIVVDSAQKSKSFWLSKILENNETVENNEPYTLMGKGYWYCMPSEEDNRWFFINCAFTENVECQTYSEDFLKLIASSKCTIDEANEDANAEKADITVTMNEDEFKGLTTVDAENKLKEMGFVTFRYDVLDAGGRVDLDGKIGAVEIKTWEFGKGDFSQGDTYKKDAIVVLWTYKYVEPQKPSTVSYSTNDYDTAKKGNVGVFSYKKSGAYDVYWIIDFDEGYAYTFTEGNGENTYDRLKMVSGNLNERITVLWDIGGDQSLWKLHFKYVDHPETLVVNDHNGFATEFSATKLDDALALRNKKTIINF